MPWFKVDDGFYDHPKVKSLHRGAVRKGAVFLWNQAGSWSARYLTDGLVPPHMLDELGANPKDADALVAAVLWHTAGHNCGDCPDVPGSHYLFHQWDRYQPTREQVEADRAAARERMTRRRRDGPSKPSEQPAAIRDMFGGTHGATRGEI